METILLLVGSAKVIHPHLGALGAQVFMERTSHQRMGLGLGVARQEEDAGVLLASKQVDRLLGHKTAGHGVVGHHGGDALGLRFIAIQQHHRGARLRNLLQQRRPFRTNGGERQ